MISEAEIRRSAAAAKVDPMVLDLDYSLGWFLAGVANIPEMAAHLVFKGGTCLRKFYFDGYRFSEDLDFTAVAFVEPSRLSIWVEEIGRWVKDRNGPDFAIEPIRVEIVEDEYGKESYQIRVYYRGPLVWGGSPRVIRVDVTRDEKMMLPSVERILLHGFSDSALLGNPTVNCYALAEVMAEKLRAISGQRRFAMSRDLYDIYHLFKAGVSIESILPLLPAKFATRGVDIKSIHPEQFALRKSEFERDWHKRLSYLVSGQQVVAFEDAWKTSLQILDRIKQSNEAA